MACDQSPEAPVTVWSRSALEANHDHHLGKHHWETMMLGKVYTKQQNRIVLGRKLDLEPALASVNIGIPSEVGMGVQDEEKITSQFPLGSLLKCFFPLEMRIPSWR